MEFLWTKDKNSSEYIDYFAAVKVSHSDVFNEWDQMLSGNLKWLHTYEQLVKNNEMSTEYLIEGHRKFLVENWSGAMMSYNKSLCFAEPDSVNETVAYVNRAECFFKMELYTKSYIDIMLAIKRKHAARVTMRLKRLHAKCLKYLSLGLEVECPTPKLSFNPNEKFPCLADVLEIRENGEFGRHIVAKCDIDAGKEVLVTKVFASGTVFGNQICCRNCNKTEQNFISCPRCVSAVFCSGSCSEDRAIHQLECRSLFHVIGDTTLKLPIQTILMAIQMFRSIDDLMDFVERVRKVNRIPSSTRDSESRYALFLNLSPFLDEERIYPAYQAYTSLMTIPQVKRLLDTERKRRFLMHLTLHHLTVIPQNSFRHERFHRDWILTDYIYDVLSLINHSCVPNVFNYSTSDEVGHCVTVRKIRKGEQIFINYLGNECKESLEYRRKSLRTWDFECKCPKCVFQSSPNKPSHGDRKMIAANPSWKYIAENCQKSFCKESNSDLRIRPKLKKECVNFLQEFGHLVLTPEIRFVKHCFTLH